MEAPPGILEGVGMTIRGAKVSVIMNCFNGAAYLHEAIESVFSQTYGNWEIVFWDNCSTDGSGEIAKSFGERLRYFRSDRTMPLGEARNQATGRATGEYIALLDSDDIWLPTKLQRQVRLIESDTKVGLTYCDAFIVDRSGRTLDHFFQRIPPPPTDKTLAKLLAGPNFIPCVTIMARRSAVFECEGFDPTLRFAEDIDLLVKLAQRFEVRYVPEPLAKFRLHESNLTGLGSAGTTLELIRVLRRAMSRRPELTPREQRAVLFRMSKLSAKFLAQEIGLGQAVKRLSWRRLGQSSPSPLVTANPMFSVIMPVYNMAGFVGEAIESVLSQSIHELELIVIDDGSTDRTPEILERYRTDPRLRVVRVSHSGISGQARNRGLSYATAPFVAFLDADDVWMPNKLERFLVYIQETAADFVFSNGVNIDREGTQLAPMLSNRMKRRLLPGDPLLLLTCVIPLSSVVVRRTLLGDNPFIGDIGILGSDDYQLWLKLHQTTEMHFLPEKLLLYRLHPDQISGSYSTQLQRVERMLANNQDELERHYGRSAFKLAMALIRVRKEFAAGHPLKAAGRLLSLPFSLANKERRSFWQYMRYGAARRAHSMLVRKIRPGLRT